MLTSFVVEVKLMVSSRRDWVIQLTVGGTRLGLLLSVHFLRGAEEIERPIFAAKRSGRAESL